MVAEYLVESSECKKTESRFFSHAHSKRMLLPTPACMSGTFLRRRLAYCNNTNCTRVVLFGVATPIRGYQILYCSSCYFNIC